MGPAPSPWGGPTPYGFDPRPPKKANGGLIVGLVCGGVLVVILLVIGVVALSGSGDDPGKTSGRAASQAGIALGRAAGVALTGTYAGEKATFSVTKAGTARGTYSADGVPVSRVDIDGTTYLKAGSAFWKAQGLSAERADKADGKWTKAPDFAVELNLSDLSPARLSQVLRQAGNDPRAVKTPVNGVETIKMAAGGRTYYIAAKGPRRLVRVEGNNGDNRFSFDVTPLTGPTAMGPVFTALRADVRGLENAYDPEISVVPTSKLKFGDCSEPGCTVSVDVRPSTDDQSSGTIRVTMNVSFRGTGSTVSTCSAATSARSGQERSLRCRTSGRKWSSWYRSQTGRFTIHAGAVFSATVNSSGDVSTLLGKLDQEQRGG